MLFIFVIFINNTLHLNTFPPEVEPLKTTYQHFINKTTNRREIETSENTATVAILKGIIFQNGGNGTSVNQLIFILADILIEKQYGV